MEAELVPEIVPDNSEVVVRAEVDIQIATAHRFPRSPTKARNAALSYFQGEDAAERAAACTYAIPRAGNPVEGASIRFAEIIMTTWGNLRIATRVVEIGEKRLRCQAVAHDLESNVAISSEVAERLVTSKGERYKEHQIISAITSAGSKAIRNAVLRCVPKSHWEPIWEETRKIAASQTASSLPIARQKAFAHFKAQGISQQRILDALGKQRFEDVDLNDVHTLRGFFEAIKEGSTTLEEVFPLPDAVRRSKVVDSTLPEPPPEEEEAPPKRRRGRPPGTGPTGRPPGPRPRPSDPPPPPPPPPPPVEEQTRGIEAVQANLFSASAAKPETAEEYRFNNEKQVKEALELATDCEQRGLGYPFAVHPAEINPPYLQKKIDEMKSMLADLA